MLIVVVRVDDAVWILIWKLSPARKVVAVVRSVDWLRLSVPRGRPNASSTLEPVGSSATDAPVDCPSAPPYWRTQFTAPPLPMAATKAVVVLATLHVWPAKVPDVVPDR